MTDKMKCPFCGAKLNKEPGHKKWFYCVNANCAYRYTTTHETIWQALIGGKKAQDALKVATVCIENVGNTWRGKQNWTNDDMDEIRSNIENYCDSTLKKIASITTGGNKE